MLTEQQIKEFRKYLKNAENPLFFFDGDSDGFCSYLILKKYAGKGKGVILQRVSSLSMDFYYKVEEYSPDIVFILDIANVDQEFIDNVNVPIIWLDHHEPTKRKGVKYFNPGENSDKVVPTSYMAYKIAEEKDLFLGTLGSIADWYYPEFAKDFSKKYPDILPKKMKNAGEINFNSDLGKLIELFDLFLKNPTSKVHKIANILLKIEDPYELLKKETPRSKFIYRETKEKIKEYESLMEKVESEKSGKEKLLLIRLPKTKNSYTSRISNYLIYKFPKKVIILAREGGDNMIMSIRSNKTNIRDVLKKSLQNFEGFGGGHKLACGAGIRRDQFEDFINEFKENLK